jgi:hypothetical protein
MLPHVAVQLSAPSEYVAAACWDDREGQPLVHPLFIKQKLNALLFSCAVQKGLADVIMEMLSFEGAELKIMVRFFVATFPITSPELY